MIGRSCGPLRRRRCHEHRRIRTVAVGCWRFGHWRFGHCRFGHCRFGHCRFGHCRFGHCRFGHCRFGHCRFGHCRRPEVGAAAQPVARLDRTGCGVVAKTSRAQLHVGAHDLLQL
ncbi:pentapeptide repeat-containing protein [Candidatus Poriferisodalis sp.]|uniref:pentapeptide repeat-containing protein n=1 Tax=Candidatus Poriferisodalis sp. TaxID=3101277 RepID=UPI003D0CA61B